MTHAYFDASGLSKRYARERGTLEVNHAFTRVWPDRMRVLAVGAGEVMSVLRRRRNAGLLTAAAHAQAVTDFRAEVLDHPAVHKTEADMTTVRRSLAFIDRYSVNATDALVLRIALDLKAVLTPVGDDVLLVSSDQRLVTAAAAEGLPTFDPERQSTADFDARFTA